MKVVQRCRLDVHEQGTEAAAVTLAMVVGCAVPDEQTRPIEFCADHPFLILLQHVPSGRLLFTARVEQPPAYKPDAIGADDEEPAALDSP